MSIRVASNIFVYPSCGCLLTDKIGSYLSICIVSIHILKFVGPTNDPPLQHKKRVDPFSESPSKQPEVQDEYILLGDQQKFGPSVKYHWKKFPPSGSDKNITKKYICLDMKCLFTIFAV